MMCSSCGQQFMLRHPFRYLHVMEYSKIYQGSQNRIITEGTATTSMVIPTAKLSYQYHKKKSSEHPTKKRKNKNRSNQNPPNIQTQLLGTYHNHNCHPDWSSAPGPAFHGQWLVQRSQTQSDVLPDRSGEEPWVLGNHLGGVRVERLVELVELTGQLVNKLATELFDEEWLRMGDNC